MINPIVIAGPTGSGKTGVASALARLLRGEIISADSRQVYKFLTVGTNKAGTWDQRSKTRMTEEGIPQHLTDIMEPSEIFSAGDFVRQARKKIDELKTAGTVPIITGGTGLYLTALIDGLAPLPERDQKLRDELVSRSERRGGEFLYRALKPVDPESAEKNRHNPQRLIRAIEVYRLTGAPLSEWHRKTEPSPERFLQFGISWEKEELYRSLNRRCTLMLESGMIEETKNVISMGFSARSPGLQSLGYRHIIAYLDGTLSRENMEELLRRDTRHYAKRQITWFKRDSRIRWIHAGQKTFDPRKIADCIAETISNLI